MKLLSGKKAFIWQNLSAVYLALFTPYLVWLSLTHSFDQLDELLAFLSQPSIFIPGMVALGLLLIHSWVGLRDILIDYAPRAWLSTLLGLTLLILISLSANLIWFTLKVYSL